MPQHILNVAYSLLILTYSGVVTQEGCFMRFKGFRSGYIEFVCTNEGQDNTQGAEALTLRARTYKGYIPEEEDLMRFERFQDGYLLFVRPEGNAEGNVDAPNGRTPNVQPEVSKVMKEGLNLSTQQAAPQNVLGASVDCAIELTDTDTDDEDDDVSPFRRLVSVKPSGGQVGFIHAKPAVGRAASSASTSQTQHGRASRASTRPLPTRPSKDEKFDMALYIFSEDPMTDFTHPEAWVEFRKIKYHNRRVTTSWVSVYQHNREEIEERIYDIGRAKKRAARKTVRASTARLLSARDT
ncbi:unnamed protein product [Peniophora sp. CBMAI 1063]|nr:unnamed protein product [Peniophora sp. CBMAI 1063]